MVAPLIIVGAIALGSVAVSVASGYLLEKSIGDKDYSDRDLAVDVALGLIPGAALAKPGAKIALSLRRLRHFERGVDTAKGAVIALAHYNRRNFKPIGIWGATTVLAGGVYDYLSNSGGSSTGGSTRPQKISKAGSGSSTTSPTGGKSSSGALRTRTSSRTRSKRWCPRHRKYDYCN